MKTGLRFWGWLVVTLLVVGCDSADRDAVKNADNKKADQGPAKAEAKAATYKVEKGPFRVEVSLKGIVESKNLTEVAVRTEAWSPSPLVVLKAVEHGTAVHAGDPLIWLDLDKITDAIDDLKAGQRLAELTIKQAEEELPILKESTPLDILLAERAKKTADEDLKNFLEVERPLTEKTANFRVKSNANYLEYAKEELRQLEKMYRSGDIREETEEIILKRQRNAVEMAAFFLQVSEILRNEVLKLTLPRQEVTLKDTAEKQGLLLKKAKTTLPLTLSQKTLALDKLRYETAKAASRLQKLLRDREAMTVKAPADGIVYYGRCVRGQWTTASTVGAKLQRGGMLQPEEVVLTIVKPGPVVVRAVVEEKDLPHVRKGMKGKVVPTAAPDHKLPGMVENVSPVPVTAGSFDATVTLDGQEGHGLLPGMACTVKLVPYRKEVALTVPAKAVFPDELDDDKHYVYLAAKNGKPEKRPVTVGKTTADKVEITGGLQEGDEILQEAPGATSAKLPIVTPAS
jgi:RND family efflux transporter MFP subunit